MSNRIETGKWLREQLGRLRRRPPPARDDITERLMRTEFSGDRCGRLRTRYEEGISLPVGADEVLHASNPRLVELRRAYAGLELPALVPARWSRNDRGAYTGLRDFRGETTLRWRHRELPRTTGLKMFIYLSYIEQRDASGLLKTLQEDGLYGCWTHEYDGRALVSRDLLDSTNQLLFLELQLSVLSRPGIRVLDIRSGYGQLAHRMTAATPGLRDYCCVDAVPEATFLCEYYLKFRGCSPPARVVPLHQLDQLQSVAFDVAVNPQGFSECKLSAVEWWLSQLTAWKVPMLFVVGSEADGLVSLEEDGSRHDLIPVIRRAGYELAVREPVINDQATREILEIEDRFHLFELR